VRKTHLNAVKTEAVDIGPVKEKIERVAQCFARYLDDFRVRGRTKHAVMGPVGKILKRVADGTTADVLGYGINVHEAQGGGPLMPSAAQALRDGVEGLAKLLEENPSPTFRDRVLERVDYATFYHRKRRDVERMAAILAAWRTFAVDVFEGDHNIPAHWKRRDGELRYPGPSHPDQEKVKAFYEKRRDLAAASVELAEQADDVADTEEEVQ
jgi:hypothetical protein